MAVVAPRYPEEMLLVERVQPDLTTGLKGYRPVGEIASRSLRELRLVDDFIQGGAPLFATTPAGSVFGAAASGVGATVTASTNGINAAEHALGVITATTGTTIVGAAGITWGVDQLSAGWAQLRLDIRLALGQTSDVAGQSSRIIAGFHDGLLAVSADGTDGAYFRFDLVGGAAAGKWTCVTRKAGVETTTLTTTQAPTANVYQVLTVDMAEDGSRVDFWIDDATAGQQGGTLVATHVTNVPGAGNLFGVSVGAFKSAGVTAHTLFCDYIRFHLTDGGER